MGVPPLRTLVVYLPFVQVLADIRAADFVAVDGEMTGLDRRTDIKVRAALWWCAAGFGKTG